MANSKLLGKKFKLHHKVFEQINLALKKYGEAAKKSKGFKRAMYITQKAEKDPADGLPLLTYEATKRIYHDLTNIDKSDQAGQIAYDLAGGDFMRVWCNYTLKQARDQVKTNQKADMDAGIKVRDKDKDDEDMTKVTIDPMNTQDNRYIEPAALQESLSKIKSLMKKIL